MVIEVSQYEEISGGGKNVRRKGVLPLSKNE